MMRPGTEAELAECIAASQGPLVVRGGGTRALQATAGDVLETRGLTGVTLYEPGALTLVARAGTPLHEVEALLASENQRLAFEPPDMARLLARKGQSTIGGVVGDNASGPRRMQVGACRDALIGIRMVDGHGQLIKNGGRVMKNVTGYDLVKLMAGSRGVLGVLSEVSFKLQARPEAELTLCAMGLSAKAGLDALRRALNTPYDISGAAHLDAPSGGGASQTLIRIEGLAGSVAYRSKALEELFGDCTRVEGADCAMLWQSVRDVLPFADSAGAVWRLSVTPTKALVVPDALTKAGIDHQAIWDWAGGRLWLLAPETATDIIATSIQGIGHARLIRTLPGLTGQISYPPEDKAVAALSRGLGQAFDPRGLFRQAE